MRIDRISSQNLIIVINYFSGIQVTAIWNKTFGKWFLREKMMLHKVKLTPATINANARFFTSSQDVPTEAYTMGIGSILQAKHIILLAFGEQKADAINKMVNGKITTAVPASILQKHPNVTVILDKQAASKLA